MFFKEHQPHARYVVCVSGTPVAVEEQKKNKEKKKTDGLVREGEHPPAPPSHPPAGKIWKEKIKEEQ